MRAHVACLRGSFLTGCKRRVTNRFCPWPCRFSRSIHRSDVEAAAGARPWRFPEPPPPPTTSDLKRDGLPLLHRVSQHASEGRIFLSGWKHDDGTVQVASYQDVLGKAKQIASFLKGASSASSSSSLSSTDNPKLVAHLNVPGWEYIAAQWGAWATGFGSVPLALTQKTQEMEHVLKDSNPQIIFVGGSSQLRTASRHFTHRPGNVEELLRAAESLGMADRIVKIQDVLHMDDLGSSSSDCGDTLLGGASGIDPKLFDSPALILYTSGTTGLPKGVVITHRNIFHQVTDLVSSWEWEPSDVALHVLPLHHVHGVVNLNGCAAYAGARLEFQPFDAVSLWRQWAGEINVRCDHEESTKVQLPKPNILMAVPTIYAKLLEAADKLPSSTIASAVENTLGPMRLMVSGSAALPVSVLEKWRNKTGHTLLERYGMTEFAMALSNPYREENETQRRWPGYVGQPLPSVQARIVDQETGGRIDVPGISGELQVQGPTVFQRYLNREDATKEAFTQDGYFRTGDVAQYDSGAIQSYRILGRASVDIIKTGGHKLSALEIERVLLEHPDIAEVVILGLPDEIWGERVAMICRMKSNDETLTLDSLREWCAGRLSKYKVPSCLLVVDDIPKNAMGKVNKKNLSGLFLDQDSS